MSRTYRTYTFDLSEVERLDDDGKPVIYGRSKLAETANSRTRMLQAYVPRFVIGNDGKAVEVSVRNAKFVIEADYDITSAKLALAKAEAIEEALAPKAPAAKRTRKAPAAKAEVAKAEVAQSPEVLALLAQIAKLIGA